MMPRKVELMNLSKKDIFNIDEDRVPDFHNQSCKEEFGTKLECEHFGRRMKDKRVRLRLPPWQAKKHWGRKRPAPKVEPKSVEKVEPLAMKNWPKTLLEVAREIYEFLHGVLDMENITSEHGNPKDDMDPSKDED